MVAFAIFTMLAVAGLGGFIIWYQLKELREQDEEIEHLHNIAEQQLRDIQRIYARLPQSGFVASIINRE